MTASTRSLVSVVGLHPLPRDERWLRLHLQGGKVLRDPLLQGQGRNRGGGARGTRPLHASITRANSPLSQETGRGGKRCAGGVRRPEQHHVGGDKGGQQRRARQQLPNKPQGRAPEGGRG